MFDQIRLHDVVYDGYVRLYIWIPLPEISLKAYFQLYSPRLYIWIPHPEISLKAYFQLYSPITLLDIESFHFPRV